MRLSRMVAAGGLLCVAAATAARRRLVVITVEGHSMEPTLLDRDRVLVLRRPLRRVRRGQIVVLESPHPEGLWARLPPPGHRLQGREWVVKRAVALPGDPVPPAVAAAAGIEDEDARVPSGSLVLIGDGKRSGDSRKWGPCPGDRLLGVVVARLPRRNSAGPPSALG
ncbi:signal peptidase I [Sphaerisporangium sp. NPDC049003]|uniref:signal peptidase I n=1 Tax=Sphaerisporangium sp. NPDC049003 TaxID=3364517 RepID=UPI003712630C